MYGAIHTTRDCGDDVIRCKDRRHVVAVVHWLVHIRHFLAQKRERANRSFSNSLFVIARQHNKKERACDGERWTKKANVVVSKKEI
jgi:hypothetical protein